MNPLEPLSTIALRGRSAELARELEAPDGTGTSAPAALAHRLRDTGEALAATTVPREQFRADLRTRLMAVAAVQGVGAATTPAATTPAATTPSAVPARTVPARSAPARTAVSWRSASRAGGVAAGAMASVVAVTGVAVAGSQSLPGDPFYGVKRTTEALQLQLSDGDVDRGTLHLDLASTRLREVRGLALGRDAARAAGAPGATTPVAATTPAGLADGAALGAPVAERVRRTLADMDESTLEGQELLDAAFRATRDAAPLQALARFTDRQSAGLEQLIPSLPAATRDRARTSLALLTDVADDTQGLLASPACGPACDPAAAAPTAPPTGPVVANPLEPSAAPGAAPCGCLPAPTPEPQASPEPARTPGPTPAPAPSGTADPTPGPSRTPTPTPSPTSSEQPQPAPLPVPVPLPVPSLPGLPPLPGPLPTLTPLPEPVATLLPSLPEPIATLLPAP